MCLRGRGGERGDGKAVGSKQQAAHAGKPVGPAGSRCRGDAQARRRLTRPSEDIVDAEGGMDLQQLLAAAQQMQDHLMSAQQELADAQVEGTSGGGLVTARVNGQGELVDLTIRAAAIDPSDPEDTAQTVADLVLAAVRNAYSAVADLQQEKMGPLAGGLGGAPGGSGVPEIPGLSEFFGGGADDEPGGQPELPGT